MKPVESKTRTHYGPVGSRGGARRGGEAVRVRVGRNAVGSIRLGGNPPSDPPADRKHCPERLFGSTNSLIRT